MDKGFVFLIAAFLFSVLALVSMNMGIAGGWILFVLAFFCVLTAAEN